MGPDGFLFSVSDGIDYDYGAVTINIGNHPADAADAEPVFHWARDPGTTEVVNLWELFDDWDDPDSQLMFSAMSSDSAVVPTVDNATGELLLTFTGAAAQADVVVSGWDPHGVTDTTTIVVWSVDVEGMTVEENHWADDDSVWSAAQNHLWLTDEHRWSTTIVPAAAAAQVDWIEWWAEPWEGQTEPQSSGSWFAQGAGAAPALGSPQAGDWFIYPVACFDGGQAKPKGNGERWRGYVVTSVEWEGVDPGDGATNLYDFDFFPAIFPERNNPAGRPNSQVHNKAKVKVTIHPPVPPDLPVDQLPQVVVKVFDPDSWLAAGADPNDPNAQTHKPDDNLRDGVLDDEGNPPHHRGITPYHFTLTLGHNQTTQSQELTITYPQPGNNYIVAALRSDKSTTLEALEFREDGFTLHFPNEGQGLDLPSQYHTELLTVWRTLWVESDHMEAPGDDDGPFTGDANCMGCDDVRATPGSPTIDTLRDLMSPAFVSVLPVPLELDTQDTAPFKHFQLNDDIPNGLRNVKSSQHYWAVHLLGAYEFRDIHDNDPNDEVKWLAGWSPEALITDDPTNFVFYEVARDVWTEPEIPGGAMVPLATGLDRISAHEALHRFFGWHTFDPAADEGIMAREPLMTAPAVSLTNRQIKIIQAKGWPK